MIIRLLIFRARLVGIDSPFLSFISPSKGSLALADGQERGSGDTLMIQKMPREPFFVERMECKKVGLLPRRGDWQYEISFHPLSQ
jgi:hypothetical protein